MSVRLLAKIQVEILDSLNKNFEKSFAFNALRETINSYSQIDGDTWFSLEKLCCYITIPANQILYKAGDTPKSFSYVYSGLLRAFISNDKGKEYTKRFFSENSFPGAMVALLLSKSSEMTIETLEASTIILIDHVGYRKLLRSSVDLQAYHIQYLEKNWLIKQERHEISLVQESASKRYQDFLLENSNLENRIALFHIASHLGITPTQLSRIRNKLSKK